jgi:hypothetical protein
MAAFWPTPRSQDLRTWTGCDDPASSDDAEDFRTRTGCGHAEGWADDTQAQDLRTW